MSRAFRGRHEPRVQQPMGDSPQSCSKIWIGVERFDTVECQAAPLGLLTGADIDVVQDLEVVGQKLDRNDEHGSAA